MDTNEYQHNWKKKWLAHRQHRCDNNQHSHLLQKTHTCRQFDPDHNPAGRTSGQLQMETQRLRDTQQCVQDSVWQNTDSNPGCRLTHEV